jgi:hypothetical protein
MVAARLAAIEVLMELSGQVSIPVVRYF